MATCSSHLNTPDFVTTLVAVAVFFCFIVGMMKERNKFAGIIPDDTTVLWVGVIRDLVARLEHKQELV